MRLATLILCLLALALPLAAQTPISNLYAAGVSYNPGAPSPIAGTGLYARLVTGGTYAFSVVDAVPVTVKPFAVTTNIAAGIAQQVASINGVGIYIPTAAGISYSGTSTGWSWSTGGMAVIAVKGPWRILPSIRFLKSSVSNGEGYQVIAGVMVGWGR